MPIYEYQCKCCGKNFDHYIPKMNPPESVKCPGCKTLQTQRRLSVFAARSSAGPVSSGQQHGICGCGKKPGSCGGMN